MEQYNFLKVLKTMLNTVLFTFYIFAEKPASGESTKFLVEDPSWSFYDILLHNETISQFNFQKEEKIIYIILN